MMKRIASIILLVATITSLCTVTAFAGEQWDSLASASADLLIIDETYSGYAKCEFIAVTYYADQILEATYRLYQDDNDYMCWTYTNISVIDETVTYPVTRGHDYFLGMHVKVKDADGNIIDECIGYTDIVTY